MRVVVTGGAGFIGANLVHELALAPDVAEVVVVDDLSTGDRSNVMQHDRVRFAEGSILERAWFSDVCAGAQAIVHLGAIPSVPRSVADPVRSHHANATGTVHVLEVARELDAFVVVASSSSVYGATPELPKHEGLATIPLSPYAASKLASEAYALAYQSTFGVRSLAFRFFNVYGPLQSAEHAYAAVVPRFVSAALTGQPLTIHGDGMQTRDFTFVGTVTKVLADAVRRQPVSVTPVNLAFGSRTSILELAAAIGDLLCVTLAHEHVDPRPGDVRDSQADNTLLLELFPDVQPVALEQGLAETIAWFRSGAA